MQAIYKLFQYQGVIYCSDYHIESQTKRCRNTWL